MAYRVKKHLYNDKLTVEENLLLDKLYELKMSGMAEVLEKQFMDPNADLEKFELRIAEVINGEYDARQTRKFNKLKRKATLKYPNADFDDRIYEPDRLLDTHTIELLSECKWIDEPRNLLITGSTGAGKSYLANALCISALRQMRTVKYIRANALINECLKWGAKEDPEEYVNYLNELADYDLLVIDDFGLMTLDIEKCRNLFEVLESRDSRRSTVIVSQLPVENWWDLFGDNTYADACLSRVTHKAHRLECNGKDMRKDS